KNDGKKFADVQVPVLGPDCEVAEIDGRVILIDGTVIPLRDDHIFKKYIFESEENEVEQTFFYLPGISSNCIIEYYIEYVLKKPYPLWYFQKDVFLKYGELFWKFYRGEGVYEGLYEFFSDFLVPNYVIINKVGALAIEKIEEDGATDAILFQASNMAPYKSEENIIGEEALKAQLICFYQNNKDADSYWSRLSQDMYNNFNEQRSRSSQIKEIVKLIPDSLNQKEKINFVFKWTQDNFLNVDSVEDDRIYQSVDSLDSILIRRYGDSKDINTVFCQILNSLKIDAYPVYCVSRSKNLYRMVAKYWQFDHQITAVKKSSGIFDFYDPSDKFMPPGYVDWQYEGIIGFPCGLILSTSILIPFSSGKSNSSLFYDKIEITRDLKLQSAFMQKYSGHCARTINKEIEQLEKNNKPLTALLDKHKCIDSVDSLLIKTKEASIVSLEGKSKLADCITEIGKFLVLEPFKFITKKESIEPTEKREIDVQLDFAYTEKRSMEINLPENISVYKLPKASIFKNEIGECIVSFILINKSMISIVYSFI
ncbi:MAG TPA: hypothetical protein VLM39_13685, partial [Ignavibacteriaceae bacterium]|nr:hypothetical protein [Ignavibacteriaceae bacterium]